MAYPYPFNSKKDTTVVQISGQCSAGTVTVPLNIPHGSEVKALAFHTKVNAKAAIIKIHAYANPEQTATSAVVALGIPTTSALVTAITLATTTTVLGQVVSLSQLTQPLIPTGFHPVYGLAVTIATTKSGGTGTWHVDAVAGV